MTIHRPPQALGVEEESGGEGEPGPEGPPGPAGADGAPGPAGADGADGRDDGLTHLTEHGGVGNDSADNSLAFVAALDAAIADGTRHVYLPPGIYQIAPQAATTGHQAADLRCGIDLSGYDDITISGAGPSSVIKMQVTDSFVGAWRGLLRKTRGSGLTIRDLCLDGAWDGTVGGHEQIHLVELGATGTVRASIATEPDGLETAMTLNTAGHSSRFSPGDLCHFYADSGGDPIGDPIVQPTGIFTLADVPGNDETVTLGLQTYTWKTVLTGAADEILIDGTSDSLDNFVAAVMGTAGAGTTYGTGTVANARAFLYVGAGDTVIARAKDGSSLGEVETTETMADGSWSSTTLKGGPYEVLTSAAGVVTFTHPVSIDIAADYHLGFVDQDVETVHFDRVTFQNGAGDGLRLQGEAIYKVRDIWVTDCELINCKRAAFTFQRNVEDVAISRCYAENVADAVVDMETSPANNAYSPRRVSFLDCNFVRVGGHNVDHIVQVTGLSDFAQDITFSNCTIRGGGLALLLTKGVRIIGGNIVGRDDAMATANVLDICRSEDVYVGGGLTVTRPANASGAPAIGLTTDGGVACTGVVLDKVFVNQYAAAHCIEVNAASQVTIDGCHIRFLNAATATHYGINVKGTIAVTMTDIQIVNCSFMGAAGGGDLLYAVNFLADVASSVIGRTLVSGCSGSGFARGARYAVNSGTFSGAQMLGPNPWGPSTSHYLISSGPTHVVEIGLAGVAYYYKGTGSPNTVVTAPIGSTFIRTDGSAGTILYVNTDGATAWTAYA